MHRTVLTATALVVFGLGMTASMAQTTVTPKVNPPASTTTQPPVQTQPTGPMNLNSSQNPYQDRKYMQTPVQQPKR